MVENSHIRFVAVYALHRSEIERRSVNGQNVSCRNQAFIDRHVAVGINCKFVRIRPADLPVQVKIKMMRRRKKRILIRNSGIFYVKRSADKSKFYGKQQIPGVSFLSVLGKICHFDAVFNLFRLEKFMIKPLDAAVKLFSPFVCRKVKGFAVQGKFRVRDSV